MSAFEVVPAHDGKAPGVFLWIDPEQLVPNGDALQAGPLTSDEARALALELLDAVETAEGLGQ